MESLILGQVDEVAGADEALASAQQIDVVQAEIERVEEGPVDENGQNS